MTRAGLPRAPRQLLASAFIAQHAGCSSRQIAPGTGVKDEAQVPRLLHRTRALELAVHDAAGRRLGEQHEWRITRRGLAALAESRTSQADVLMQAYTPT